MDELRIDDVDETTDELLETIDLLLLELLGEVVEPVLDETVVFVLLELLVAALV